MPPGTPIWPAQAVVTLNVVSFLSQTAKLEDCLARAELAAARAQRQAAGAPVAQAVWTPLQPRSAAADNVIVPIACTNDVCCGGAGLSGQARSAACP